MLYGAWAPEGKWLQPLSNEHGLVPPEAATDEQLDSEGWLVWGWSMDESAGRGMQFIYASVSDASEVWLGNHIKKECPPIIKLEVCCWAVRCGQLCEPPCLPRM